MYIQSSVPNFFINILKPTSNIYLEWSWQLMWLFLVVLLVNNDLIIYVFATSVGCEVIYVDTTELKNILYISARVAWTMNFNIRETWMLRLKTG